MASIGCARLAAEGPHQAEARLYLALAARGQGQMDAYERAVRELAEQFPTQSVHRGRTQRPGDLVGGWRRRRRRRRRLRPDGADVPGREVRRAGGLEGRVVGLPPALDGRRRAVLRDRRVELPALGLSPVVALLERPREGTTGRRLRRCGPLHPRGHRLPEQLLRPAGAAPDGQAVGAALDSREPGAAADAAAHASPDRLAAVARPQRPGARRDPVRPPHLGRFAEPWSRPPRWPSTAPAACASASTP